MSDTYILIACGAALLVPIIGLARAFMSWRLFRRQWRESAERHNRRIAELLSEAAKAQQGGGDA